MAVAGGGSPRKPGASPGTPLGRPSGDGVASTALHGGAYPGAREHSPPEKLEPSAPLSSGYDRRVNDSISMTKSKSENWMDAYRDSAPPPNHQRLSSDGGRPAPAIPKKPLLLRKEPGAAPGNYENVYRGDAGDVAQRNRCNASGSAPGGPDDEVRRYSYAPETSSVASAREEAMRASRQPRGRDDSEPVSARSLDLLHRSARDIKSDCQLQALVLFHPRILNYMCDRPTWGWGWVLLQYNFWLRLIVSLVWGQ